MAAIRRALSPRLKLLISAAMSIPSVSLPGLAHAQTAPDGGTLSLGYLDYFDKPSGRDGIQIHSPTLYFRYPLGARTEIEGGLTYDSVSGASPSGFGIKRSVAPTPTPVVVPKPPPCRLLPIDALSRASNSGGSSSGGSHGSSSGSSGGSSGGGVSICSNGSSGGGGSTSGGYNENENDDGENEHEGGERDRLYGPLFKPTDRSLDATSSDFSDSRVAGDVKITHYFDSYSLGGGVSISNENDYRSLGGLGETRFWTPDKNTTFALGVAGNSDDITSSADSSLSESKTTLNFLAGVTQVLSEDSILQSNITFANDSGYLTDPYKEGDNRPDSRQALAWLTRYNLYIAPADAALHLDYRLYKDSWDVLSHMLELAWYQPMGDLWLLRPSVRYYSQSSANFYDLSAPPIDLAERFSSDPRLAAFGSVTLGMKLIVDLGNGFSASTSFDYLTESSNLYLGSANTQEARDSLNGGFVLVELSKKF